MPVGFDTETALLRALDKRKQQTARELSEKIGSHYETTRINLNRLAEKGWAESKRHQGSKKWFEGQRWTITDKGMEIRKGRRSATL